MKNILTSSALVVAAAIFYAGPVQTWSDVPWELIVPVGGAFFCLVIGLFVRVPGYEDRGDGDGDGDGDGGRREGEGEGEGEGERERELDEEAFDAEDGGSGVGDLELEIGDPQDGSGESAERKERLDREGKGAGKMRKEESVKREVALSEEESRTTAAHNHGDSVIVHVDGSHRKARLEKEDHEDHEADEDHYNNGEYEDDEEYYEDDEDFYNEGEDEQWDEVSLGPPSSPNILREAPLPSLNFTPNANPANPPSTSTKAAKQKNWLHRLPPSTPATSSSPQPAGEDIDNTFPRTGGGRPLNAPLPAILDGPRTGRPSSPGYQTQYSRAGFAAASTSSARFASLARTRPDEFVRLQREGMIDDRGEPTAKWNEHLERGRKRKRTGASASSRSRSKRKAKDDGGSRTV